MTVRIWIVRHGNTFDKGETVTRVGGRTDLDLSTSGRAQAGTLAQFFSDRVPRFESAITSPLKRTTQTAETILAARAEAVPLREAEFLREIDYGPDENRPEAEVIARIGEEALAAWELRAEPPQGWVVDPERLEQGWRVYIDTVRGKPGDHLVVTSNGIARFALYAIGAEGEAGLKLPTGCFGLIELDGPEARLAQWGERP